MKKIISRNVHFLGSKIRSQRKSLNLTLEDLSIRCIQMDPEIAPSISYLSLIETGNRIPSAKLLKLLAEIFQKNINWFLDHSTDRKSKHRLSKYSFETIDFEPNFLFSKQLIKRTIPALLSQSGVSGRQFAHILIRAYQEKNHNQFPDIERIADNIGNKQLPLSQNDLIKIYKKINLKIVWFKNSPFQTDNDFGVKIKSTLRSFYESKNTVYLNEALKKNSSRLKYDMSLYIAHKVLHGGDGQISNHASGGELGGSPRPFEYKSGEIKQKDILYAWRDFECSFFAGALLCPRIPLRRFLSANSYDIFSAKKLNITTSTFMRRITAVSPYKHWHYFDAYSPGYLRAVYRGNGIRMPWGNMRMVVDPCSQWGVFKMLKVSKIQNPLSQISILKEKNKSHIYSSISIMMKDISNTNHVLCLGIDLGPFLKKYIKDPEDYINNVEASLMKTGGFGKLKKNQSDILNRLSKVLNIGWIADATNNDVDIICERSTNCPRTQSCDGGKKKKEVSWINQVKKDIIKSTK